MAISTRAVGTWAASAANETSITPAIPTSPDTPATGDLMICVVAAKPYTLTPTINNDWSTLYAESGGTTANGNGAGSQLHAIFYKVHTGSESDPTVSYGAQSSPGAAVIIVLQKGANEAWDIAQLASAVEQATGASISIDLTTLTAIKNADWVFALASAGDDSAAFTRTTTAISGAAVTWNGNYVEYPVDHLTTTNGNDLAADLGYRMVTTGTASGATVTVTGTLSATERSQASAFRVNVLAISTQTGSFTANAIIKRTWGDGPLRAPTIGTQASSTTGSLTTPLPGEVGDRLFFMVWYERPGTENTSGTPTGWTFFTQYRADGFPLAFELYTRFHDGAANVSIDATGSPQMHGVAVSYSNGIPGTIAGGSGGVENGTSATTFIDNLNAAFGTYRERGDLTGVFLATAGTTTTPSGGASVFQSSATPPRGFLFTGPTEHSPLGVGIMSPSLATTLDSSQAWITFRQYTNNPRGEGFSADAVIKAPRGSGLTANAVLRREQTGSFTASAQLVKTVTSTFTASAAIRKTTTATTVANAIRLKTWWFGRAQDGF